MDITMDIAWMDTPTWVMVAAVKGGGGWNPHTSLMLAKVRPSMGIGLQKTG